MAEKRWSPLVRAGKKEQVVDKPRHLIDLGDHLLRFDANLGRRCIGHALDQFRIRAEHRQRRAQLM